MSALLGKKRRMYILTHTSIQTCTISMGRVAKQTGKDGCAMVKLGLLFVGGYVIEPYCLMIYGYIGTHIKDRSRLTVSHADTRRWSGCVGEKRTWDMLSNGGDESSTCSTQVLSAEFTMMVRRIGAYQPYSKITELIDETAKIKKRKVRRILCKAHQSSRDYDALLGTSPSDSSRKTLRYSATT